MTLHALEQPDSPYQVVALLTNVIEGESEEEEEEERISSHHVRRRLLHMQAAALNRPLPVLEARVSARPQNGEYEAAVFNTLREALRRFPDIEAVAYGDLYLADIKAWREGMLGRFPDTDKPLRAIFPLWGQATGPLARRCIDLGFRARLVCVDTTQLDASFAGREFDGALLEELAALDKGVDPCLENGEAHTFVYGGPIFARPVGVAVVAGGLSRPGDGRFAYCDLVPLEEGGRS